MKHISRNEVGGYKARHGETKIICRSIKYIVAYAFLGLLSTVLTIGIPSFIMFVALGAAVLFVSVTGDRLLQLIAHIKTCLLEIKVRFSRLATTQANLALNESLCRDSEAKEGSALQNSKNIAITTLQRDIPSNLEQSKGKLTGQQLIAYKNKLRDSYSLKGTSKNRNAA